MYTYHHLAQRFCEVIRQSNGVAVPDQLRSVFELFAVEVMWLGFRQMERLPAEARPHPVGWVADSNKVCEVCNWEGKTLRAKYPRLACQPLERFCQAEKQKPEKKSSFVSPRNAQWDFLTCSLSDKITNLEF